MMMTIIIIIIIDSYFLKHINFSLTKNITDTEINVVPHPKKKKKKKKKKKNRSLADIVSLFWQSDQAGVCASAILCWCCCCR